ncbi:small multi-drug export protein [bacterium]|nr:small multi-drug export protein [bacterium]
MNIKKILLMLSLIVIFTSLSALEVGKDLTIYLQEQGIPKPLIVILISMLPIVELRGAIPVAIGLLGMSWGESIIYAILGNMIPIPFVLLFMDKITLLLNKWSFSRKILAKIFARTRSKSKVIERYEEIGLTLFIAIPLPVTGAWTGSLAAYLLGLKFWKSILCALAGVTIAGFVVTAITLGVGAMF